MAKKRKTWREKLLDSKDLPKRITIDASKAPRWGSGTCVVPAPIEVDQLMRCVRRGKLTTIDELRAVLARKHHTTIACPITTGIFAWIAAHAADEASAAGDADITPYWRTLKSNGEINPKYPGGIAKLKERLKREGHTFVSRGKRVFVADFESSLARLEVQSG